ncbi:PAS domain S-box-containing protein [Bacillus sp. cl95]|uniref:ATP-binding protein n=1 Tax=Bacillus sp. UNCCL13 TaxID=1502772 RepID=UPI0008F1413A|nr:ATP-binding protein [Bacillus sp. UNCCL13]SFB02715.1 PAS domain S-box-containing protein [Bacillus sp. UNCCL13]SFQ89020.1 PAS domain S-box-containing protein [Bacillus sp. cl95]
MVLLDYIINLSIFSLMVSTPLVLRSFINYKPLKECRYGVSLYAGLVSVILVMLSFQQQGYSYDIRYAPVILVFAYLGPIAGIITGVFALLARLFTSGNWYPAIIGWSFIMVGLTILHFYIARLSPIKKSLILYATYLLIYVVTVPILFHVFPHKPLFHLQYLLFVMLGVAIGSLLIESYLKLYRIINENKKMEETLASSESKYRLIAENTSDLILVLDKENSVIYFSPSHEFVLGYERLELEDSNVCKLIHPDDAKSFRENMMHLLHNRESITMEYRLQHQKGHWIEFESRCMPVAGEKSIEHIVLISRDISERKKSEELLLQSEKLSIVGELAAGVAHEIRNPLTTIKGFVQLYKSENQSFKYNDLILSELERIESITSGLLSLGKPQAIQLNRLNLKVIMEETLELLSPQAHMNGIQFEAHYEDDSFYIDGEKNQLKQVFLNILKNAMEAMKDGGIIKVNLRNDGEGNCIASVHDQGCGIPEELLPRLGEPFYSLKEKGTGLGLMICNRIIKQHHGLISYKSKVNEGTLIEIHLPLTS